MKEFIVLTEKKRKNKIIIRKNMWLGILFTPADRYELNYVTHSMGKDEIESTRIEMAQQMNHHNEH